MESLSSRLLIVAMSPRRMQTVMTSCGRTCIMFASSETVMNSGMRRTLLSSTGAPVSSFSRRWIVDTSMPRISAARVLLPLQRATIQVMYSLSS